MRGQRVELMKEAGGAGRRPPFARVHAVRLMLGDVVAAEEKTAKDLVAAFPRSSVEYFA